MRARWEDEREESGRTSSGTRLLLRLTSPDKFVSLLLSGGALVEADSAGEARVRSSSSTTAEDDERGGCDEQGRVVVRSCASWSSRE